MRKTVLIFVVILGLLSFAEARTKDAIDNTSRGSKARPPQDYKVHTVGDLWSRQSNFGNYGDPNAGDLGTPSFTWPGGTVNYYQWEGRLWIGAKVGDEMFVSHSDYGNYELWPVDDPSEWPGGWGFVGKGGTSMWDINTKFDDFNPNSNAGRALGLTIIQKDLAWSVPQFDDFFGYEITIIYNKENADIDAPPDVLGGVFVTICFDADVSGNDATNLHLDDLVCYDGWTNGEWEAEDLEFGGHHDELTIIADSAIDGADGVPDYYTIWGDEPDEFCLYYPDTILRDGTPIAVQLIERNMSYIFDDDNPAEPGDDAGENGGSAGYIFGRFIYTPLSPSDSVWLGPDVNGDEIPDTCRMIRPYSHQWWNWSSDPGTDETKYKYMDASHSASMGWRFLPHPFDVGAPVFDYRFLLAHGPFDIADGDTLKFVFIGGVGQELSGGIDEYWGRGKLPGARQVSDLALKAYYSGSSQSDPLHPSAPDEDVHWLIPVPPESPNLVYSSGEGVVSLAWDDIAERTPDPMDGEYDFAGYNVYRSAFKVGAWEVIGKYDTSYVPNYPHTYVDTEAVKGRPYYYTVTAYDLGRPPQVDPETGDTLMPAIAPLESGKSNYKKDAMGAEAPVFLTTARQTNLDKATVVPNPYLGSVNWERQYEDKIAFMYLPGACRIQIFSITGDLVREIKHRSGQGDAYWDLRSKNDQDVVSGLYIYKIELYDENGGVEASKVGKFLILR